MSVCVDTNAHLQTAKCDPLPLNRAELAKTKRKAIFCSSYVVASRRGRLWQYPHTKYWKQNYKKKIVQINHEPTSSGAGPSLHNLTEEPHCYFLFSSSGSKYSQA